VPAGEFAASQWAALAQAARTLSPDEPLHLTTRQDVEIHGLTAETVPQAQAILAQAGLTCVGACGDTIRNVTVCPCSGVCSGCPDLTDLARRITELLQAEPGAFALPRKLKVCLSACPKACSMPYINDLGLVAKPADGGWRFDVVVAGSLGAKPATGIPLGRDIGPDEALPLALAALRLFAARGNRENRRAARLRHVRQTVGDAEFLDLLGQQFQATLAERTWPRIELASPQPGLPAKQTLHFDDGNMVIEAADALASLAGRDGIRVRVAPHHRVIVFGRSDQALSAAIAEAGLASHSRKGPRVVTCPGTRWCSRALADTQALASAVRKRIAGAEAKTDNVLIGISGCPNGCAHSGAAAVGAVGLRAGGQERWNVLTGGQGGRGPGLAGPLADKLSLDEAADAIAGTALGEPLPRLSERNDHERERGG